MLITREREKLINAIIYFVNNTKSCGLVKLFKLLSFLDFEHFRQTGRSVTGLNYFAWPWGPVPRDLFLEIKAEPKPDLARAVTFSKNDNAGQNDNSRNFTVIRANTKFDPKYFSRRELKLLEDLAFIYNEVKADDISKHSHSQEYPWYRTIKTKGEKAQIDYELALDDKKLNKMSREQIEDLQKEYEETRKYFA